VKSGASAFNLSDIKTPFGVLSDMDIA
jgi:hypothetical protein